MFHIVYKTTHTSSGRYYIGVHSTEDVDDGYLGSGKHLLNAVKKYGKTAFTREILHYCTTREEAFTIERNIVTEYFVGDHNTFNLAEGGRGHSGKNKLSRIVNFFDESFTLVHTFVSLSKAGQFLKCDPTIIRLACINAQQGKASFTKGYYVCYDGDTPHKKDTSYLLSHNKEQAKKRIGRKRPNHSAFMHKYNNTSNPTGDVYFTPHHPEGVKRNMAAEYYTLDMINTWCKNSDVIICKMSISKLKKTLSEKVSYDWVGKTRKEVGFYSQPRS